MFVSSHIGIGNLISFLDADVNRCSVDLRADGEAAERIVGCNFLIQAPVVKGSEHFHYAVDMVFSSFYRVAAFRHEVI